VTVAASNAQAKTVGGVTAHSAAGLQPHKEYPHTALGLGKNKDLRERLEHRWGPAHALIWEESSMVCGELYQAVAYRATLARVKRYAPEPDLNPQEWSEPGQEFGAMPLIIHLGDFLQLRPREMGIGDDDARVDELWANPKIRPSKLAQKGRAMFQRIRDTHILVGGRRFIDDDLPAVLDCMRRGVRIPDELWRRVLDQAVRLDGADPRLSEPEVLDGDECGIAWQTVARWMVARSKRDAARAGEKLYVVPAIDKTSGTKTRDLTDEVRRELLTHVNAMDTGKMAGMCPIHIGQRVRLSVNLCALLGLVPETEGTVCSVDLDPAEQARAAGAAPWPPPVPRPGPRPLPQVHEADPVVILKHHPQAVYVQLDKKDDDGNILPTLADKLAEIKNLPAEIRRMIPQDLAKRNIIAVHVRALQGSRGEARRHRAIPGGRRAQRTAAAQAVPSFPFTFFHEVPADRKKKPRLVHVKKKSRTVEYRVKRYQLPLLPARVRTAHSAQGRTFKGTRARGPAARALRRHGGAGPRPPRRPFHPGYLVAQCVRDDEPADVPEALPVRQLAHAGRALRRGPARGPRPRG